MPGTLYHIRTLLAPSDSVNFPYRVATKEMMLTVSQRSWLIDNIEIPGELWSSKASDHGVCFAREEDATWFQLSCMEN